MQKYITLQPVQLKNNIKNRKYYEKDYAISCHRCCSTVMAW